SGPGSNRLSPPGAVPPPNDPRYGRPIYTDRGGAIQSPDDPRYVRPAGRQPVAYSGPVMSPDDPRYGRTDAPAVIYADRPAGAPQPQPYGGDDYSRGVRPPGTVGPGQGNVTGS